MAKKPSPFNNPFGNLKLARPEEKKPQQPARAPAPPPPAKKAAASVEDEEAALFRQSVGSVDRVRKGAPVVASGPPPSDAIRVRHEDDEVLEHLALLVGGAGEFEVADSEQFIEGWITGLDRRIVQKLKRGEYPVGARLDLHGMTRAEAKVAVERFVLDSRRAGKRCVLIVHGRGLHSEDQIPVLKEGVQQWLSRGRVAKEVIAFVSARPADGGVGALYVLLRR